ncbi:MAG: iron chelate uptake ABC transporter family permease subunit [Actinobacteria bacterium]|nr:iron chelate uptake ABC transporter family permease subunit [Actinomycetota bacterium]
MLSVGMGTFAVAPTDVVRALLGRAPDELVFVVRELRLPRALTGALVGAALGASGAVFQSVARNPLASPDLLGISAGASVGAVLLLLGGNPGPIALLAASAGGASGAAVLIAFLARRHNGRTPYRLVLVGIGVAAALTSVTSYLLVRAGLYDAERLTLWLTGSLNARTWADVGVVLPAVVVGVPALAACTSRLRLLELGDDLATGLGVCVGRARGVSLAVAVVLAAAAVAGAGPIEFVALAAPQIARRAARAGDPAVVVSALCGAVVVVGADLAARVLFSPIELPVGVVTAVVGAPYLLRLLVRANRPEVA